jgi:hypothetical protein
MGFMDKHHIISGEHVLLSKKADASWRKAKAEFVDYKASSVYRMQRQLYLGWQKSTISYLQFENKSRHYCPVIELSEPYPWRLSNSVLSTPLRGGYPQNASERSFLNRTTSI